MNSLFWRVISLCLSIVLFPAISPQAAPISASRVPKISVPVTKNTDWQEEWKKTIAEAKLEGKVSIAAEFGSNLMHSLGAEFKKKYGIEIEYVSGTSFELFAKVNAEQTAGLYLSDIVMGGGLFRFSRTPILSPMEASLILPEVKDINVWLDHKLPFFDEEGKIFMYLARVAPTLLANKEIVKPEEIKSWLDLLGPKWKGKILLYDPSIGGGGNGIVATVGEIMGINYLKDLAKQEPFINRNKRLQVEWVARGKYPVGMGFAFDIMEDMRGAGAPLMHLVPTEGTFFGSSTGSIAMFKRPAHPNAAKVFLNWILSKEGQTVVTKIAKEQSRRVDVVSQLAPDRLRQNGIKYIDADTKHMVDMKDEMLTLSKEIFASQYK